MKIAIVVFFCFMLLGCSEDLTSTEKDSIKNPGKVDLKTNFQGASVYVNNNLVGVTPCLVNIEAGEYSFVFKRAYCNDTTRIMEVIRDGTIYSSVDMICNVQASFSSSIKNSSLYMYLDFSYPVHIEKIFLSVNKESTVTYIVDEDFGTSPELWRVWDSWPRGEWEFIIKGYIKADEICTFERTIKVAI